jgi:acetyl esterase/lipase
MSRFARRDFLALASTILSPPLRPSRLPENWLRAEAIPLWPGKPPGAASFAPQPLPSDWSPVFIRNVAEPNLHVFRPRQPNGHALLVLPGGSYWFVSVANEGAALAPHMTAHGVTVFVLTYRLPGEGWPSRANIPLQDAQRALRVIRSQASRYKIDANKVSVLGFSAGGHLAATLATQHAEHTYSPVDAADRLSARPFAAGLVYPVVTMMKPWTHEKSRNLLLGEQATDSDVKRRSAEMHIDATTPPVFTVHAMDDVDVPVENSLRLMNAMREAKRPIEAHLLQRGGHAFGVGHPNTPSEQWTKLFSAWLMSLD